MNASSTCSPKFLEIGEGVIREHRGKKGNSLEFVARPILFSSHPFSVSTVSRVSSRIRAKQFEAYVFKALSSSLASGVLGLRTQLATIHARQKYHSRDRDSMIVVDVAIELRLKPNASPTLIWVFECKSLRRPVSVDDIEEFHAKIQQIGENNTEGTIVTESALQKSALSYARAKGIGVIRVFPEGRLDHVLFSVTDGKPERRIECAECETALIDRKYRGPISVVGEHDGRCATGWQAALRLILRRS